MFIVRDFESYYFVQLLFFATSHKIVSSLTFAGVLMRVSVLCTWGYQKTNQNGQHQTAIRHFSFCQATRSKSQPLSPLSRPFGRRKLYCRSKNISIGLVSRSLVHHHAQQRRIINEQHQLTSKFRGHDAILRNSTTVIRHHQHTRLVFPQYL